MLKKKLIWFSFSQRLPNHFILTNHNNGRSELRTFLMKEGKRVEYYESSGIEINHNQNPSLQTHKT